MLAAVAASRTNQVYALPSTRPGPAFFRSVESDTIPAAFSALSAPIRERPSAGTQEPAAQMPIDPAAVRITTNAPNGITRVRAAFCSRLQTQDETIIQLMHLSSSATVLRGGSALVLRQELFFSLNNE